jgi:hypothetical protein
MWFSNGLMSDVKIILMTKDDLLLIHTWIVYHGELLGYENLHILDNSQDPRVLDIYNQTSNLGYHLHSYPDCNLNTAERYINIIRKQIGNSCNFIAKFDTDEFLAMYKAGEYVYDRGVFKQQLEHLNTGTNHHFYNSYPSFDPSKPTLTATLFQTPEVHVETDYKQLYTTKIEQQIDLGGHGTREHVGNNTGMTVLHYHRQPFETYKQNLKKVCISHGWFDHDDTDEQILHKLSTNTQQVSSHKREALVSILSGQVTETSFNQPHSYGCTLTYDGVCNVYNNLT